MTTGAPPGRTHHDAMRWMSQGTGEFLAALTELTDDALLEPLRLPGWTGRHLLAHLAANAEALQNLVRWARTGRPSPMYSSTDQRANDIEAGSHRSVADLRVWVSTAAEALQADLDALSETEWDGEVVTAQGRTVTAREIPWMRSREVFVHAVDLGNRSFAAFPQDFLAALVSDAVAKRTAASNDPALHLVATDAQWQWQWQMAGAGQAVTVDAPLADLVAYLTGRPGASVQTADGRPGPTLTPWL